MNENVALIFKSVRKFNRLQQTEMAAILRVSQGTISKIESAGAKPELTVWFDFVNKFGLKDPYSCLYGGLELKCLDAINIKDFKSPFFVDKAQFNSDSYFLVKDIRPLIDYLRDTSSQYVDIFDKYTVHDELFSINNHPLYCSLVENVFAIFKGVLIHKRIEDISLASNSSFSRMPDENDFSIFKNWLSFLNGEVRWCEYDFLKENHYKVYFKGKDYSFIKNLGNSELILQYFSLLPYISFPHKNSSNFQIKTIKNGLWEVRLEQRI